MSLGNKIHFKHFLAKTAVPDLTRESLYFSLKGLQAYLLKHRVVTPSPTLLSYLHQLTREGLIHSAGRGWYSTVAKPFELDTEVVTPLVAMLGNKFPLLDFSVWSTAQIAMYGHHLTEKFLYFIRAERDGMTSVYDYLRESGWNTYLNPTQADAKKFFRLEKNTAVVRPSVTQAPVKDHFVQVEGILVDLFVETADLGFMDRQEFIAIARSISASGRLDLGTLSRYAVNRRRLDINSFLRGWIN